ncbi:MAG: ABC transporter permease, partial [Oscillospiraceae bacterium]
MIASFFKYLAENSDTIGKLLFQHIQLTALSVAVAILIGVPLGILISRYVKLNKPILGFANVVQAIPSMAILGFLIPVLGIGQKPAIFMVVIYSLLPIIKNTATGLSNINSDTIEAARGIGMTELQILFKVQFPMALPVIMA